MEPIPTTKSVFSLLYINVLGGGGGVREGGGAYIYRNACGHVVSYLSDLTKV
jgi:hypothetical protein